MSIPYPCSKKLSAALLLTIAALPQPLLACRPIFQPNYTLAPPNKNCQFEVLLRDRDGNLERSGNYLTPVENIDPLKTRAGSDGLSKTELFSDCQHHIRYDTGGIEPAIGISFYHLGKQLHSYGMPLLVTDPDKLEYRNGLCMDITWYKRLLINESLGTVTLETIDDHIYVFSISTGEILKHQTLGKWWQWWK